MYAGGTPSDAVAFGPDDFALFAVDEPRLRADAIRQAILPRLRLVVQRGAELVAAIYGVEPMVDSIVSEWPNFRRSRDRELEHLYDSAFCGLGGRRERGRWPGLMRRDGKPVQILPARLGVVLDTDGITVTFHNDWLTGLDGISRRKFVAFLAEEAPRAGALCAFAKAWLDAPGLDLRPIEPFAQVLGAMLAQESYDLQLHQEDAAVAGTVTGRDTSWTFALLWPFYDAYIRLATREAPRFGEQIDRLNAWLTQPAEEAEIGDGGVEAPSPSPKAGAQARRLAEARTTTPAGLRWRVFRRDRYTCVACGRSPGTHGIALHADHIRPRSRGGADTLENLQTLCADCNLGKGNRDATDLRMVPRSLAE